MATVYMEFGLGLVKPKTPFVPISYDKLIMYSM